VAVVGAFAQFAHDTGTRLTFFINGANSSWSVNAPALRPMVDSGLTPIVGLRGRAQRRATA
jgi:hypothetical protein